MANIEKKSHGGKREGSGRPPAKEKKHLVRISMTDEEEVLVRDFIEEIRKK